MSNIIDISVIILLILLNAFFAAAEIALASVRRARVQQLVEEGNSNAALVQRLTNNPSLFLATIQIVITLSGFFTSAFGVVSLVILLAGFLKNINISFISTQADTIALVLITTLLSFLSLLFGELVPKSIAITKAEQIALAVARPIYVLSQLTRPMVAILTGMTNLVLRLLGQHQKTTYPSVSAEEIRLMVETAEDEGVIPETEGEMIDNIFDAGDRPVRDVMIPRVDVIAISETSLVEAAKLAIMQSGHTRLPVYRESIDNVIGVIHAKDLLQEIPRDAILENIPKLIRPTIYIPEGRTVNILLRELRQQRTHMAIVLDEYGGTAGVVTLEDLLEEIVGPIRDEYDHQEIPELVWIDPQTVLVNGSLPLDEFEEALDLTLGDEANDADTVGGLIFALSGKIPHEGEIIDLPEVTLKVTQMQNRRITRLEAHRKEPILPAQES